MHIEDLLRSIVEIGASDIHLTAPYPPVVRIDGELLHHNDLPNLTNKDVEQFLHDVTDEEQRKLFSQELELDFAHSIPEVGRFRANAAMQKGNISLSFRSLQVATLDIDDLGLPDICKDLILKENGLLLVTGPTGSGKSTTIAAMVKYLNGLRSRRLITVEDPIEFLHENDKCFITQREVGSDTHSFSEALKHTLRQDPDVILVGEMRDLETMGTALTAAETGHLVLATLHTPSAPQAIDRIIDVFPPHQQQTVRIQVSTVLQGVLYQTLIPRRDEPGRVPALEIMLATDAIRNLIREARTAQMWSTIQTSSQYGMQTMDQAVMQLFNKNVITLEEALRRCRDPEAAKKSLSRATEQPGKKSRPSAMVRQ
jgi:twitching motility protein PilT